MWREALDNVIASCGGRRLRMLVSRVSGWFDETWLTSQPDADDIVSFLRPVTVSLFSVSVSTHVGWHLTDVSLDTHLWCAFIRQQTLPFFHHGLHKCPCFASGFWSIIQHDLPQQEVMLEQSISCRQSVSTVTQKHPLECSPHWPADFLCVCWLQVNMLSMHCTFSHPTPTGGSLSVLWETRICLI